MLLATLLLLSNLATWPGQSTPEALQARIRELENENQKLQQEADALRRQLQQAQGGAAADPAVPTSTAGSRDPGPEPWGTPAAAIRSLTSKFREELQAKGGSVPGVDADPKARNLYRKLTEAWIKKMAGFRQSIEWTIVVGEVVQVSSQPREYEVQAHVLRADGSRFEPAFSFRCPASVIPVKHAGEAAGTWKFRADIAPDLRLLPDAQESAEENPFGRLPLIAPQVECLLRYRVQSMIRSENAKPAP